MVRGIEFVEGPKSIILMCKQESHSPPLQPVISESLLVGLDGRLGLTFVLIFRVRGFCLWSVVGQMLFRMSSRLLAPACERARCGWSGTAPLAEEQLPVHEILKVLGQGLRTVSLPGDDNMNLQRHGGSAGHEDRIEVLLRSQGG